MDDDLISEAAGLDYEDDGSGDADESEDGGKADFMRMAKAIKAGDLESAWEAYQACRDGGAPPPIDDM